ncbi:MAG: GGDEF domain-containing protein, partial [Oscillospiraceae bacterium]|nr:GGDEF domain-containing protein [Oscillospiraceae bacterium]
HAAGDFVLKTVSSMLRDCACANGGWAVRWGGEEFLLIFPDNTINNTLPHIEDLLSEIRAANPEYEGEKIAITMTFGISDTSDGKNPEKTINEADARLYYGKKNGRNRIVSNDESFTV